MKLVGLTGGIASGKSTVTKIFSELGATLLDADLIAREVVEPGTPALHAIAERFPRVVSADGTLDRAALGARVFSDSTERLALNAIIHPRIAEAFAAKTQALAGAGTKLVIYDAPLLVENRIHERMDEVIVVHVPRPVQLQRLIARDGLSAEQAEARLAAQMPLDDKLRVATHVIDNSGSPEATRAQVVALWEKLRGAGL